MNEMKSAVIVGTAYPLRHSLPDFHIHGAISFFFIPR